MLKLMSVIPTTSPEQKAEEAEKILKQLLESVQDCQKRFGGKRELATESDNCIRALCVSLETVFTFGIKAKNIVGQNSSIKQVSEIITSSLNIGTEYSSFWSFIYRHLTKHERERYAKLKHIWTDAGRGKAWIRSSLNEHSLDRYFHTVLSNLEILTYYYEPWSILRDEEKNSMLPTMAAGLNSILFAIGIDKPDLNSGVPYRKPNYSSKPEPIIQAPIPDKESTKQKRCPKVSRQVIIFDEDESYLSANMSSSYPSSSSGKTSLADNISLSNRTEESSNKLPVASNDYKDTTDVLHSLTPVIHEQIEELTPENVEIDEDYDLSDVADGVLETSPDICLVLDKIENKNDEVEAIKLIKCLTNENDILRKQVNSYLNVIDVLRRREEDMNAILENLKLEYEPQYKTEAEMFKNKLTQVADMHAELMDFNIMLQQKLYKKELLLNRLTTELETLQASANSDHTGNDVFTNGVQVYIPSAFLKGTGSSAYHVYQIFLKAGNDEWNVYRRYAQFHNFQKELRKVDPVIEKFDFPPKTNLKKKDSSIVEDRRKRLQLFLRKVITHWPELANCNSRFWLEQHLPFFKCQGGDMVQKRSSTCTEIHSDL